jgi:hypothetical protein
MYRIICERNLRGTPIPVTRWANDGQGPVRPRFTSRRGDSPNTVHGQPADEGRRKALVVVHLAARIPSDAVKQHRYRARRPMDTGIHAFKAGGGHTYDVVHLAGA